MGSPRSKKESEATNGFSSFVEGSSHITYSDSQNTPYSTSSYVSFGNSGQKKRRSKYDRSNRGALKRSQDQSFMSQLSSQGGGKKNSAITIDGREISPVTNKKYSANSHVIDEESDEEIGYNNYVSRRF